MKLYRHWVAETREIAGTTFHLRDGSNVSPEDAAAKLERRHHAIEELILDEPWNAP